MVRQPSFEGSLQELLTELRSGRLAPSSLDLLSLVQSWLEHFRARSGHDLDSASETLPQMAQVLELKLRLLLPRPPREAQDELFDEVIDTVSELVDMENAVHFLRNRREDRRLLLGARAALSGNLERKERPLAVRPSTLAELAGRLRSASYFEVSRDSFGFREALSRITDLLRIRRHVSFSELRSGLSWGHVTVLFASMLELVRDGRARVVQAEPFGEISLTPLPKQRDQAETLTD